MLQTPQRNIRKSEFSPFGNLNIRLSGFGKLNPQGQSDARGKHPERLFPPNREKEDCHTRHFAQYGAREPRTATPRAQLKPIRPMAKETARSADPPKRHAPPAGWPANAGHPPAQDAGREKGLRSGTEPSKRAKGLARPWRGGAGLVRWSTAQNGACGCLPRFGIEETAFRGV